MTKGDGVNRHPVFVSIAAILILLPSREGMCGQGSAQVALGTIRLWITATERGHPATDLKAEDLQLQVGKQEQSIRVLTFNPPEPLRVGLLVDSSGSRRVQWPGPEISLASSFFKRVIQPGDQAFIVDFNVNPLIDADLTTNLSVLDHGLERLAAVRPSGGTAFYDAIEAACVQREAGGTTHRALVVITDGMDNSSRHRLDQAMAAVRRTGSQVYIIDPFHPVSPLSDSAREALEQLRYIARASGARFFWTSNKREMESAFDSIAEILGAQYALEFLRTGASSGKKGNRIKIKCSRPGVEVVAPEEF
jgi:VWFA-related protein